MVPIKHKACGAQVAWYLRDEPRAKDILYACDYGRLDGTRPIDGEVFSEQCPGCGGFINDPLELERDFSQIFPD